MKRYIAVGTATAALFVGPGAGSAFADFVCPVLPGSDQGKAKRLDKSGQFIEIAGGDQSILPGKAGDPASSPVSVPDHATNGNGSGSPGGDHSSPGDRDYTAIWNTDPE